jgi:Tfp pilus assembly protein PilN
MLLDRFIPKKYLIKSEICALEVVLGDAGIEYHFTIVKNKGKKIEVAYKGTVKDILDLPKQVLKTKIPVILVINGKGVILKKINLPQEEELNTEQIIDQNLPAINKEDLFIQVFKQADRTAYITISRKEVVNSILVKLKENKYDVADVYIGAPAIIGLQPLWNSFNRIATSTHSVELNNGNIDSIQNGVNEQKAITIGTLDVENENVLGLAVGLGYLMDNKLADCADDELNKLHRVHQEKNKLRVLTVTCVAIAFSIAVINVMFYMNYFDRNNKLETELSVYQGKYDEVNKLLNNYQSKKELIEGAGVLNRNRLSEYADRIGATIPEEVVLGQMYFNPKNEDVESNDSLVVFENGQLVIKGNCNKSLVVNEWLNVLKMQEFIKAVTLEKFVYSKEGYLPNFEIKILMK